QERHLCLKRYGGHMSEVHLSFFPSRKPQKCCVTVGRSSSTITMILFDAASSISTHKCWAAAFPTCLKPSPLLAIRAVYTRPSKSCLSRYSWPMLILRSDHFRQPSTSHQMQRGTISWQKTSRAVRLPEPRL